MKKLLERLYLVSGGLTVEELAQAIQRGGTVSVDIQKYVSVGGQPFKAVWEEATQCTMKAQGLDNNLIQANVGEVLNVMTRVVNVEKTRPVPARQFAGSEELLGLNLNLLYDFEQGVGVIQSGHNGIAVRPTITEPRLRVVIDDRDEQVGIEVLKLMGVPQKLLTSDGVLRELDWLP